MQMERYSPDQVYRRVLAAVLATGKAKDINWLMWVISLAFLAYFCIYPIEVLLGVK